MTLSEWGMIFTSFLGLTDGISFFVSNGGYMREFSFDEHNM